MTDSIGVPPLTDAASPNVAAFVSSRDAQIDALRAVVGANLRVALDTVHDDTHGGVAVAETFGYPITLSLLRSTRLPALAVWRTQKTLAMQGKQRHRNTSFTLRWWMGQIGIDRIGEVWPLLDLAYETIVETIQGRALIDIGTTNDDGEVVRIPSSSLLGQVGFMQVDKRTVRGSFDFATTPDAGFVYPVLDVSFVALTEALAGGFNYPDGDFDDLCELFATLLSATVEDGVVTTDTEPLVQVLARVDGDRTTQDDGDFIIQADGSCTQVVEAHAAPVEAAPDEVLALPTTDLITLYDMRSSVTPGPTLTVADLVSSNDATQATADQQPATGANIDGIDALDFDGIDDWLDADAFNEAATSHTIFALIDLDTTANQRVFDFQSGRYLLEINGGTWRITEGPNSRDTGVAASTGKQTVAVRVTGGAPGMAQVYIDGSQIGPDLTMSSRALGGNVGIGAGFTGSTGLNGRIAIFGVYGAAVTDETLAAIFAYIAQERGI